jgi:hypothetical protein
MIPVALLLAFFFWTGSPIAHSKYERPVQVSTAGQNYVAVDETIWAHARGDLGDVRLFSADTEIPYSIAVERGSLEEERKQLPVLQQSTVAGKTQFLIDMSGLVEYDHVELKLATRNFVAHARVEGQDDPHDPIWASLGDTILYDLSRENLGSNSMLRLPRATYKFLRVTIDGPVAPREVESAVSETSQQQPAVWRDISSSSHQQQDGKDTVITFSVAKSVAVERVTLAVDPSSPNFRRDVEIKNEKDAWLGSGEISRIHMVRAGRKIDSENQSVSFSGIGQPTIKVVIHNGDDRPLQLSGARLQQLERRVYFDASALGQLTLYYGDEKLAPPVYDYAKLFQQDKAAARADLRAEAANAGYTERSDDRPWSERHPVVLWIAIIAAVLGLTSIALRSVRTATA